MLCFLWIFPATVLCKENQAMVLLKAMSAYVGEQQTIELSFDSDIEIINPAAGEDPVY
jgi:hypothetical protein